MANQPARDKKWISVLLKRETVKKLQKLATSRGKTRSEVATALLEEGTRNVELTAKDYEDIAKEIREQENKSKSAPSRGKEDWGYG